jgi:hypothetical protein
VVVIGSESLRMTLWLTYEFGYDNMIMLMMCYFIESILRAGIVSIFFSKVLTLHEATEKQIQIFKVIYYMIVGSLLSTLFVVSLINRTSLNCEGSIFSYHWFILDAVDIIQSVLILYSALKLRNFLDD